MTGILLINTGSPDSFAVPDVRRYLREFLMDGRVLDLPWPLRAAIVYGCILPFRPKRSAHAYEKIWTFEGSPLVAITQRLATKLPFPTAVCMRYGRLTPSRAIRTLRKAGAADLLLVPMFPHYALSSYESAVEHVRAGLRSEEPHMEMQVLPPFYRDPAYLGALAATAAPFITPQTDHVLFSYHGMPVRHLTKVSGGRSEATCYVRQTQTTTAECASRLGLRPERYSISYQSRLGSDRWLEPHTDSELIRLAKSGVRNVAVMCPSFTTDCLETLEEIAIRGREAFLNAGGRHFEMVPALNDSDLWARALTTIITGVGQPGQCACPG